MIPLIGRFHATLGNQAIDYGELRSIEIMIILVLGYKLGQALTIRIDHEFGIKIDIFDI